MALQLKAIGESDLASAPAGRKAVPPEVPKTVPLASQSLGGGSGIVPPSTSIPMPSRSGASRPGAQAGASIGDAMTTEQKIDAWRSIGEKLGLISPAESAAPEPPIAPGAYPNTPSEPPGELPPGAYPNKPGTLGESKTFGPTRLGTVGYSPQFGLPSTGHGSAVPTSPAPAGGASSNQPKALLPPPIM